MPKHLGQLLLCTLAEGVLVFSLHCVFSGWLHAQTWWLHSACKLVYTESGRKRCMLSLYLHVASGGLIECGQSV